MESRSHALMAGVFTLVLLAAVLLGGWWLTRDRTQLVPYVLATRLSVGGLSPQASVRYRGLEVGKVKEVKLDPTVPGQILVYFGVRPETPMTQSTYAMLSTQGVTGMSYVELNDDGSNPEPMPSSEGHIAQIEMRPSILNDLQTKANSILDQTEKLSRELTTLFNKDNQALLVTTLQNISRAAQQIEKASGQLQPTLGKLPAVADKAGDMVDSITTLSRDLQGLSGNLSSFIGNDGTSQSISQLHELAEDLHTSLQLLNQTLDQFSQRPAGLLFGAQGPVPGPGEPGYSASSHSQ